MTNNKNKTAIETIVEFVKGGMPYKAAKPYDRDLYSSIAELDARLSALETSASEPKDETICLRSISLEQATKEIQDNGGVFFDLETSAKASEPKECICPNYRIVSCPVHDGDESTSVEKIEQPSLQLAIFQMKKLIDLARDDVAFTFKNHSLHQLQITIVKGYEYALEILERNSKKEEK